MGHRVTGFRAFARDLADSRHDLDLTMDAEKSRALYQQGIDEAISLAVPCIATAEADSVGRILCGDLLSGPSVCA
jgi:hypothetical protein